MRKHGALLGVTALPGVIILIGTVILFFCACSLPSSDTPKSSTKNITGFSFTIPSITGTIDETTRTISVTVPWSTPVNALIPTITHTGASLSPASLTAQDFTKPVVYTVTADDSSTQTYTVTVTVASDSDKAITSFSFINPAATGTVDSGNGTIAVTIPSGLPPFGINVHALVANFSATGVSVQVGTVPQISGITKNDFSTPVTYTVTAQNGSAQNYVVTVSRSAFKAFTGSATVSTIAGLRPGSTDGSANSAQFIFPSGIATDGTNLFITDSGNNTVRVVSIATGNVTTLAGSAGSSGNADGTGNVARFSNPKGIAINGTGTNLYVADSGNNMIRSINIASGAVTTLVGIAGGLSDPSGLAIIGTTLYVADSGNHVIRSVNTSTGTVTTFAGAVSVQGSANGPAAGALFDTPRSIATDGTTYLYVADTGNNTIRQITVVVPTVTTIAGSAGASGSADGIGIAARFNSPSEISIDNTNANLYISDFANHTIRRLVIGTGAVTTLAGTIGFPSVDGTLTSSADGTGTAARFGMPLGSVVVGTNLYIADGGAFTIRRLDISTSTVTTFAGNRSHNTTDGAGTAARFGLSRSIATDGNNLYICDSDNFTIRKIVIATGEVSTVAGLAGSPGSADGTGIAARFNLPQGITTDGTNLYVADSYNHSIRKIVIATNAVTTLAGTSGTNGSANGDGSTALFNRPLGITTDGIYLYVADTDNDSIRRVEISTGTTITQNCTSPVPLSLPFGITTDGTNLYVSEWGVNTIRKINIVTGATTSITLAGFSQPAELSTDGTYVYVVDWDNGIVGRIEISSGAVTTVVSATAGLNQPWGIANDGIALYVTDCMNYTIRKVE